MNSGSPVLPARLVANGIAAAYQGRRVVHDVSLSFADQRITVIVGPSGAGKSTFLRCLNRMHETRAGASIVAGTVMLDGLDIYGRSVDAASIRRQVGMVLQQPTPFPMMSIRENVAAGLAVREEGNRLGRTASDAIVEEALRRAGLWAEVRDRLNAAPTTLSVGQQQRLCIARVLATSPKALLLDEPTAALDHAGADRVEELIYELRGSMTVVIVTHNLIRAARLSDVTAFMLSGALVEVGATSTMFTAPSDPRTEAYVTGRLT